MIDKKHLLAETKDKRNFSKERHNSRIEYRNKDFDTTKEMDNLHAQLKYTYLNCTDGILLGLKIGEDKEGHDDFFINNNSEEFEDFIDDIGDELVKLFPNEELEDIEDALFDEIRNSLMINPEDEAGSIFDLFLGMSRERFINLLKGFDIRSVVIYGIDPEGLIGRWDNPNWYKKDEMDKTEWGVGFPFVSVLNLTEQSEESIGILYDFLLPFVEKCRKTNPKMVAEAYADYINWVVTKSPDQD